MAQDKRNRQGMKGNDAENRTGAPDGEYRKLPDNPNNEEDTVSTAGDSSNGKYSKTNKRDDEVDNNEVRGGS
jgi:hypothetical protein